MHRFWNAVILPVLEAAEPAVVVEVGAGAGLTSRPLLEYCRETGGTAHLIDPTPRFDLGAFEQEFGDSFVFHEGRSLNELQRIEEPADVVLIDGDPNWYTVYHELQLLKRQVQGAPESPPVVLLHNTGWPYARRDRYHDPESIPPAFRKPYERKGVLPGQGELAEEGLNADGLHAVSEDPQQNGVRSAMEDFLEEEGEGYELAEVPELHGITVLAPPERLSGGSTLPIVIERIRSSEFLAERVEQVERERIAAEIARQAELRDARELGTRAVETAARLEAAQEKLDAVEQERESHERELANAVASAEGLSREREAAEARVAELSEALESLRAERQELRGIRDELARKAVEVERLRVSESRAREALAAMSELRAERDELQRRAEEATEEAAAEVERLRAEGTESDRRTEERLRALKEETESLRSRASDAESEAESAAAESEARAGELEGELELARQEREELRREASELEAGVTEERERAESLAEERDELEERIARLESERKERLAEIERRVSAERELSDRLRERELELARLEEAQVRGQRQLEALAASKSWRYGNRLVRFGRAITFRRPEGPDLGLEGADGAQNGDAAAIDEEQPPVTIVIPIFNALDEARRCLDSVIEHSVPPYRVLLVDDRSTDPEVLPTLERYAGEHEQVELMENPENLGYTPTVNRGCREAEGDVIVLNSDTEVTPGWNQRLAWTAYSRPSVATVTPVSNAAGAFTIPDPDQPWVLPEHLSVARMGELVTRLSDRVRPEVPTGSGFCMYVTRAALDAAGYFDEERFREGYGEENDFCLRATGEGLVHLIDDQTFVYHTGAASFGGKSAELREQARARMRELHPRFKSLVREFYERNELAGFGDSIRPALQDPGAAEEMLGARPTLLFVLHAGRGGTPKANLDLLGSISNQFRCLVLVCGVHRWTLNEYRDDSLGSEGRLEELERQEFERWQGHEPLSPDRLDLFRRICSEHEVALVHLRHTLGSGPELIDAAKDDGIPVVFSFHDYTVICPTLHLLDEHGEFCGGECTPGDGPCPVLKGWFPNLPPLKHRFVYDWRERYGPLLARCDALVTTSETARELVRGNFPELEGRPFHVIEHGRHYGAFRSVSVPPDEAPIQLACFGAFSVNKGIDLLSDLMRINNDSGGPFEFHFFGAMPREFDPAQFGATVHGTYQRERLSEALAEVAPSYSLVTPTSFETFCHTLTESWMCGLPTFASDIGTVRERVLRAGGGWLLDYRDPRSWYEGMLAATPEEWSERRGEIERMPFRSLDSMGLEYRRLYRELIEQPAPVASG